MSYSNYDASSKKTFNEEYVPNRDMQTFNKSSENIISKIGNNSLVPAPMQESTVPPIRLHNIKNDKVADLLNKNDVFNNNNNNNNAANNIENLVDFESISYKEAKQAVENLVFNKNSVKNENSTDVVEEAVVQEVERKKLTLDDASSFIGGIAPDYGFQWNAYQDTYTLKVRFGTDKVYNLETMTHVLYQMIQYDHLITRMEFYEKRLGLLKSENQKNMKKSEKVIKMMDVVLAHNEKILEDRDEEMKNTRSPEEQERIVRKYSQLICLSKEEAQKLKIKKRLLEIQADVFPKKNFIKTKAQELGYIFDKKNKLFKKSSRLWGTREALNFEEMEACVWKNFVLPKKL